MCLPLEQELHFGTNQLATDGKDTSSFEREKGMGIVR